MPAALGPSPEPTIADVLAESRVWRLEQPAETAEIRAAIADGRLATTERLSELRTRLDTLFEAIAGFRAEYNAPTRPEE